MTLDFSKAILNDGDFTRSDDYHELIEESERVTLESWITLAFEETDDCITVDFVQEIEGYRTHCPGDYWTPPDSDFDLTDEVVHIVGAQVNDVDIEMTPELEELLIKLVCAEINRPAKRNAHLRV